VQYLVRHIIIELNECPFDCINDRERLDQLLIDVAEALNTEVIGALSHQFQPYGITALLIVGASHLSIHSWPEFGYASFDMLVCTDGFDLSAIIELVKQRVESKRVNFIEFRRGLVQPDDNHQQNSDR